MEYLEFELEIERVGKGKKYRARVRKAPAGRGARTRSLVLPSLEELEELRSSLGGVRSGGASRNLRIDGPSEDSSADLGLRLFLSVFKEEVLESWRRSLFQAQSRLRLRLSLDNDPHLLRVPWELLFDPELKEFIATTMPVVRTLDVPIAHPRALAGLGPLRILTILSGPSDYATLDTPQEWSGLDRAFGDSVELRSVPPLLDKIDQALQTAEWHVLHFVGHGSSDTEGGFLILENGQRSSRPIDHLRLSKFLGHPSLRLVVLNACYGGLPGSSDPFSGVAQALLRKGIPAVVAMQQPVSDRAAIALAEELYDGIAKGLPLDAALLKARARLYRDFDAEWAIPVLYLNAPSGEILAEKDQSPPPPPSSDPWRRIALITSGLLLIGWIAWMSLRTSSSPKLEPPPGRKPLQGAEKNPPECPSPPGLNMAFVKIDPGTFIMGDEGMKESRPTHRVTITRPFCIGRYEVTQEQLAYVSGSPQPSEEERYRPAHGIKYDAAQDFIRMLNESDPAHPYRLATEAEWEYVARGKSRMRYSFLGNSKNLVRYANCGEPGDGSEVLSWVGQYPPNPSGTYDMYGNVFEWVFDWYSPYTGEDAKDPAGPSQGEKRIRRGGSWKSGAKACTSAARSDVLPNRGDQENGFRIVREIR